MDRNILPPEIWSMIYEFRDGQDFITMKKRAKKRHKRKFKPILEVLKVVTKNIKHRLNHPVNKYFNTLCDSAKVGYFMEKSVAHLHIKANYSHEIPKGFYIHKTGLISGTFKYNINIWDIYIPDKIILDYV